MTDPGPDHARFDELAAGHALHALEPDDERWFLSHAQGCRRCQQVLASYADVAAALAEAAPPAEPSPQLGPRILAAALAGDPPDEHPVTLGANGEAAQPGGTPPAPDARVIPMRRRSRPRWLNAAAAAAAVAVIAGGTWAGIAASSGTSTPQPLAACGHPQACPQVPLTETAAHRTTARVIITAGSAWLLPDALPADDTADQIYVLWQITAAHAPLPVGSFDIRPGAHQPVRIGSLAGPYRDTKAFVVSLEHGRAIPAAPTHVVALGHVAA